MRRPLIAGNFKMYKDVKSAKEYAKELLTLLDNEDVDVLCCCPYLQLQTLIQEFDGRVKVGAQNVHFEDEGAYTGEISAKMLKEIGVDYCIVGHSERRQYFNETDEALSKKLPKLFENGIIPILCVGESLQQRQENIQQKVVKEQLEKDLKNLTKDQVKNLVIAYEPIWAIGTGLTASKEQAEEMCKFIRETVSALYGTEAGDNILIQYGGSVKPENAKEILSMENIDGALVGGASLVPEKFIQIINF